MSHDSETRRLWDDHPGYDPEPAPRPLAHIRRDDPKRPDWRIQRLRAPSPINPAICGGELTAYDLTPRDTRKTLRDPEWRARICPDCIRIWEAVHAA